MNTWFWWFSVRKYRLKYLWNWLSLATDVCYVHCLWHAHVCVLCVYRMHVVYGCCAAVYALILPRRGVMQCWGWAVFAVTFSWLSRYFSHFCIIFVCNLTIFNGLCWIFVLWMCCEKFGTTLLNFIIMQACKSHMYILLCAVCHSLCMPFVLRWACADFSVTVQRNSQIV